MKVFSILSVLIPFLVGMSFSADACVIIVDDDLYECPNADATTIQAGIDLARPGGKVYVCPGTYDGGILVKTARLKLLAQGPLGEVKIVGEGASGPAFGITVIADGVHIEGFEIYGFNGQPHASGILVGGLFPLDTLHPADEAVIEHNMIHNNGNGIFLWQSNNNEIHYNEIFDNKNISGIEGAGIRSFSGLGDTQVLAANAARRSGKNNDISYNVIYNNDHFAIFAGACTDPVAGCPGPTGVNANISGTRIHHNEAYGNGILGMAEAIGLMDAHGGTIAHNKVHDNGLHGILIFSSDAAKVKYNRAYNNGKVVPTSSGIRIQNSSNIDVIYNKTDSNNGRGIRVSGSTGDTFKLNSAFDNTIFDLQWDGAGIQTFIKNKCGTASPSKAAWDCK